MNPVRIAGIAVAVLLAFELAARAQLVADGDTAIIDGISTNLADSDLTVGTNGSYTLLVLTNSGTVTDTNGYIGYSAGANNNQVTVTDTGSLWTNSGGLAVGSSGSSNTLLLSKGGQVASTFGGVGVYVGANNNQVTVTDAGSLWTNSGELCIACWGSSNNLLLITNGGQVVSTNGFIGSANYPYRSDNNQVVVTGPNSLWTNSGTLYIGLFGSSNNLLIANGGRVVNTSCYISNHSSSSNSQVVVTGPNSLWANSDTLYIGYHSSWNNLLVTNGGQVSNTIGYIGYGVNVRTSNNQVMVVGPNSLWTNSSLLYVGHYASWNSLLITNGGQVANTSGYIGYGSGATNNQVIVTGPNSLWTNSGPLYMGFNGSSNNLLIITNGGQVASTDGSGERVIVAGPNSRWSMSGGLGFGTLLISDGGLVSIDFVWAGASGNQLIVSGPGSMLTSRGPLTIGSPSSPTTVLLITNGGAVQAASARVYFNAFGKVLCLANGTLTVPGGLTVNNNSFLTGSGIISGVVTNASTGTVSPGAPIGRLILSNSPVLQGTVLMDFSRNGLTLTNDQIQVTGPLKYGGFLTVSNLGPTALLLGDSFKLFSATSYTGAFTFTKLPALPPGLSWTNKLLVDGSIAVIGRPIPTLGGVTLSGTNLIFEVTGGAPGGDWNQLTTTNVTLPISSWTTNQSGVFGVLGNATLTNEINFTEPQHFFLIQTP
jgi:T5SS/PEP-CTERM-associated repeat protein